MADIVLESSIIREEEVMTPDKIENINVLTEIYY